MEFCQFYVCLSVTISLSTSHQPTIFGLLIFFPSLIYRNNEKRKEKSRDAARCRRSRETEIFQDLASLLPMRQEDVDHLDKASVMRLSIAYLKVRDMLEMCKYEISTCTKWTSFVDSFPIRSTDGSCAVVLKAFIFISSISHVVPMVNKKGESIAEDGKAMCEDTDMEEDSKPALNELALEKEKLALLSLDGFLLVLSADGDITYISENVSDYLGLSQVRWVN